MSQAGADTTGGGGGGGNVSGPGSSVIGSIAIWANTAGTLLADAPSALITGGVYTNTLQPSFYAYCSNVKTNVTGANVPYQVIFDVTLTNVGSDYDETTGIFTAPATGVYLFTSTIVFTGVTDGSAVINSYVGSVYSNRLSQVNSAAALGTYIVSDSWQLPMTQGDTIAVLVDSDNSTQTVSIFGAPLTSTAFNAISTFTGQLLG